MVTPCAVLLRARGSTTSPYSECACMSMKPGANTSPSPSITLAASGSCGPTLTIVSPATARFPPNHGPPVPSTIRAPRMSRSGGAGSLLGGVAQPARIVVAIVTEIHGMRLICRPPGRLPRRIARWTGYTACAVEFRRGSSGREETKTGTVPAGGRVVPGAGPRLPARPGSRRPGGDHHRRHSRRGERSARQSGSGGHRPDPAPRHRSGHDGRDVPRREVRPQSAAPGHL